MNWKTLDFAYKNSIKLPLGSQWKKDRETGNMYVALTSPCVTALAELEKSLWVYSHHLTTDKTARVQTEVQATAQLGCIHNSQKALEFLSIQNWTSRSKHQ